MEDMIRLFQAVGIDAVRAKETCTNSALATVFKDMIFKAGFASGTTKSRGVLLYQAAVRVVTDLGRHQDLLGDAIASDKIQTSVQLEAAFEYLKTHDTVDNAEFEAYCGVGVKVPREDVARVVTELIESHRESIVTERYRYPIGPLLAKTREHLKWADGKLIKDEIEAQIAALLGPRIPADSEPPKKKKEAKGKGAPETPVHYDHEQHTSPVSPASDRFRLFEGEVLKLHRPGENPQINPKLMEEHLKATGGRVVTRFPPEPNGFLHIGHAKAMNFNFRYAELHGGYTYLRYDDTNPEAEEQRYFDSILECVQWLGFKPHKVTATSDYFDQLHELAVKVIKAGRAYVCHQTPEQMHQSRGGDNMGPRTESPWRNRPIEESLQLFEDMRLGKYSAQEATLRLKIDMTSGNPYMWDPVAYRVLKKPHVRTGDKWLIYPTYDFSHCLTDSIENITHSLCTTEFKLAREAYYWICDAAEVYKPVQWEYGRLNITYTVLSKRKLNKLVSDKHVNGWDDPRIYTLESLRRRGFPPKAINDFCERLGVTTAMSTIPVEMLEACVRDELNITASRVKVILNPIRVTITNYPADKIEDRTYARLPTDPSRGEHTVPFTNTIYIDASDYRDEDSPDYFRLAPGKEVGLMRAYNITCQRAIKEPGGKVVEILATYDPEHTRKPKAFIHWVAHCPTRQSPVPVEVRLYNPLFKSKNPDDAVGGFLADINPNSLEVLPNAYADVSVLGSKVGDVYQFERVGYFCVDKDSHGDNLVFNRTVTLREDPKKS